MNIRETSEQLISAVNAASPSITQKWNPLQIEALLPTLRNRAFEIIYNGNRERGMSQRIDGSWVQKFPVTINPSIQDTALEYLIAELPAPVPISTRLNGFVYVGANKKTSRFFQAQSRDEIATLKERGFINNGKHIVFMYSEDTMEIYGNKALRDFYVEAILSDPTQKPGYDMELDDYPISPNVLDIMIEVFKKEYAIAIQQPKDTVADGNPNVGR